MAWHGMVVLSPAALGPAQTSGMTRLLRVCVRPQTQLEALMQSMQAALADASRQHAVVVTDGAKGAPAVAHAHVRAPSASPCDLEALVLHEVVGRGESPTSAIASVTYVTGAMDGVFSAAWTLRHAVRGASAGTHRWAAAFASPLCINCSHREG